MINPYGLIELTKEDILKATIRPIETYKDNIEELFINTVKIAVEGVERYKRYSLKMLKKEFEVEFEEELKELLEK